MADGCPTAEVCGPGMMMLGRGCYRYVSPSRQVSWDEAEEICKSSHGYLASLNTMQERNNVGNWSSRRLTAKSTLLGLRLRMFPEQTA